jgi:hypothetical protein
MNEILSFWAQWLRPSAGLPTVQWSLLLAVAALTGYLFQRHIRLAQGGGLLAGGHRGRAGGLQRRGLAAAGHRPVSAGAGHGGRAVRMRRAACPLRWFRHNPMVLVQSIAESALTYFAVYWVLLWLDVPTQSAPPYRWRCRPGRIARRADARGGRYPRRRPGDRARHRAGHAVHPVCLDAGQRHAELINRSSVTLLDRLSPCWWCWACPSSWRPCWRWCCARRCAS